MAKEMKYAIVLWLRDQASRGIKGLRSEAQGLAKDLKAGFGAGVGGGFAKMFGGGAFGALAGKLGTRPGGAGGILSDVVKGAAGLALLPVRILNSFASLIPGVGGIISGVVGTVANILQGLIGIVANIAGGILNVVTSLVEKVVSVVGSILGKVVKIGGTIGLGIGAAVAAATIKGIAGNLQEMRLKAVLKRRLGAAWEAAWKDITRLSPVTGFEETELADTLVILARTDLSRPAQYLEAIADTAVGAGVSMGEVANLFVQVAARGEDLGRAKAQLYNFGIPREQVESIKTVADLLAVLISRYGGAARENAKLKPFQQLWRAWWEDVEALTEGLTEALVPALNKVVEWLDKLRDTDAFRKINEGIKAAVGDAIHWLETREWSWDNFRRAFGEMGGLLRDALAAGIALFASKDQAGAWHFGPLVDALKAAFDYVAAYVASLFQQLWVQVGQDLANTLAGKLSEIGKQMEAAGLARPKFFEQIEAKAGELGAGGVTKLWGPVGWAAAQAGKAVLGERPDLVGAGEIKAGQAVRAIASALAGAALTDQQKGAELARIRAQADAEAAAAAQRFAAALNAAGQVVAPLGPQAAGVLQTALPAAPQRGGGAFAAQPIADVRAEDMPPDVKARMEGLGGAVAGHQAAVQALQKQGLTQKAAQVQASLDALRQEQAAVFQAFINKINAMAQDLKNVKHSLKNLGRARA